MVEFVLLEYPIKRLWFVAKNIPSIISWQPFWISCFTRNPQGWELHIRPDITIGEPAKHDQNRKKKLSAKTMLAAVSLRSPFDFAYKKLHKYRLYNIFFKNKWNNWLSHTWNHKNKHIIYVSSVCSCKIIRKYVYFYIRWRPSWISPFWTFSQLIKKCNPFFSWSSWYFESESSEKSLLTDKMHESLIYDIWAYTSWPVDQSQSAVCDAGPTLDQLWDNASCLLWL